MSILVDFNQIVISNIFAYNANCSKKDENNETLLRHTILSALLSYKKQFGNKYGSVVICADSRKSWRSEIFPYYKVNRKQMRKASNVDWDFIHNLLGKLVDEIKQSLPFLVVQVEMAEADDVIATIRYWEPYERSVIISGDKDFYQLHSNFYFQYDPVKKKFLANTEDVDILLKKHIICGDSSDGIPNILSDDDTFVDINKKQKRINKNRLELWVSDKENNFLHDDPELQRKFLRNTQLINLSYTPDDLYQEILNQCSRSKFVKEEDLAAYLSKNNLDVLSGKLLEFYQ